MLWFVYGHVGTKIREIRVASNLSKGVLLSLIKELSVGNMVLDDLLPRADIIQDDKAQLLKFF